MNIKNRLLWPALIVLYIIFLSLNLLTLPLYLDEGLYIFWAHLFTQDSGFAYVSLQDGKTPLFIWLVSYFNSFLHNSLLTGRLISAVASAVSLICWLFIAKKMVNKKLSFFVFILFLLAPFNLLISRLAFVDSLLIAFSSLSLLGIVFLKSSLENKNYFKILAFTLLIGIGLGLAYFTKTTARLFLIAEIIILLFYLIEFLKKKQILSSALTLLSASIVFGIYHELIGYLRFGSYRFWGMIENKEADLIYTLPRIYQNLFVTHDIQTYLKNSAIVFEYFLNYFAFFNIFFVVGIIYIFKQRKNFWLILLSGILFTGIYLSAKIPASRYFAIIIPEFLTISSLGFYWLWEQKNKTFKIFSIFVLLTSAFLSFKMVFTPLNAFYSSDDQGNFIDTNLNALGLQDSITYLKPNKDNTAVAVTGIWGVAEGSYVSFKEKDFETYILSNPIRSKSAENGVCDQGFIKKDNECFWTDFGGLSKTQKTAKYIYLISERLDIDSLKKIAPVTVEKEFIRPNTHLNVYLLKLNSN